MTNLNAANIGLNRYCGPAVLSILTGKSTDECASVISQVTRNYKVEGVYLPDLLQAADKLGFDNKAISPGNTIYSTLIKLAGLGDGMYIISLETHYVVVEVNNRNIYFCDNHTKEPIPAASSARLLQKVTNVNQVFKRPEVVITPSPIIQSEPELINKHVCICPNCGNEH